MMQDLWELYKPEGNNKMPSQPEPKTDNQFLLFLEEQDSDNEVIEDEYAHYCAQPIIKKTSRCTRLVAPTNPATVISSFEQIGS
jgi:hypothetical protein